MKRVMQSIDVIDCDYIFITGGWESGFAKFESVYTAEPQTYLFFGSDITYV